MNAVWNHLWTIVAAIGAILRRLGTILGSPEARWMCLAVSWSHVGAKLGLSWDLSQASEEHVADLRCHSGHVWTLIGNI